MSFGNWEITAKDIQQKSQYWLTWNLHHYGNDPCPWDISKVTFLLGFPRTLLIWKLSLPLFFPFCLLVQASLTLEQWCLFWHLNSDACSDTPIKPVVSRIECAMCWSPRAYCSPVTSPKKLHLLSALAFVYFSLRKNSLWRSLSLVYFCLPSSRTLFILHFSIHIYLKCPLKEGHSRKYSCISLFRLSFELPQHCKKLL